MSYRDLEIWKLASEAAVGVHRMTLQELPKFEMFEEGSQIRRSVKSIRSNIVEGYGRRRYKQEFISDPASRNAHPATRIPHPAP
jgi:four helix bundle protein